MYCNGIFGQVQKNWTCRKSFEHRFGQAAWIFNAKLIFKSWMGSTIHHKYLYHAIVHIRWRQMWKVAAARRILRRPAIIASIHTCVDVV